MAARAASHAGSWYESSPAVLSEQLDAFLSRADVERGRVRAVIAPHAGYSYSGATAAFAYKAVDTNGIQRVLLLGPSHHWHTRRCALSPAVVYKTPLGDVPVDEQAYVRLRATGKFDTMTLGVDEAEHSLEMHMPYLVKLFSGQPFTLVPVVVGALTPDSEAVYGQLLAPFLDDPTTLVVVSSDFCHWGRRFGFTPHDKSQGPIHSFVESMDRLGMRLIEAGDTDGFTKYLQDSGNTICGRHPIGVLLQMMKACTTPGLQARFLAYAQSSRAVLNTDSSVSYASAVVTQADSRSVLRSPDHHDASSLPLIRVHHHAADAT